MAAVRGWRLSKKGKNKKIFTQPKIKPSPGRMAQTPRADTCDSMGRFRRYRCLTLFNYHSNFSMCGTFLQKSIHIPDNRGLLATSNEIYDLNLSAVTLSIWSSRTPASNFCTKELYNPIFFWLSLHPLAAVISDDCIRAPKLEFWLSCRTQPARQKQTVTNVTSYGCRRWYRDSLL